MEKNEERDVVAVMMVEHVFWRLGWEKIDGEDDEDDDRETIFADVCLCFLVGMIKMLMMLNCLLLFL